VLPGARNCENLRKAFHFRLHHLDVPSLLALGHGASIPPAAATMNDQASTFLARDAAIERSFGGAIDPRWRSRTSVSGEADSVRLRRFGKPDRELNPDLGSHARQRRIEGCSPTNSASFTPQSTETISAALYRWQNERINAQNTEAMNQGSQRCRSRRDA
jgi:hypothetical protein